MVDKSEILDIIQVLFFAPAILLAILVCMKQGFGRTAGWVLLVTLSIIRLAGGVLSILAIKRPNDSGVVTAALVLDGIGSATLVAVFTALVNRVDSGSKQSPFPPKAKRFLQLFILAAIILGSIGAANDDRALREAASVLILIQLLVSTFILSFSALNIHAILHSDRLLAFWASVAMPFVLVRCIYSILTVFASSGPRAFRYESNTTLVVILRGVLQLAMEIVAVSLYIICGLTAPKIADRSSSRERCLANAQNGGYAQPGDWNMQDGVEHKSSTRREITRHQESY